MKSFSARTKEELCKDLSIGVESVYELAGMMLFGAAVDGSGVTFTTRNKDVYCRYVELCRNNGIEAAESDSQGRTAGYVSVAPGNEAVSEILDAFESVDGQGFGLSLSVAEDAQFRQSFVRGAFLGGGTIIDPNKNYNLELVTPHQGLCEELAKALGRSGFEFKTTVRKSRYVMYMKNSEMIIDFLSYIGAYKTQMELINIKIEKEYRNSFNRTANGETANLVKSINASVKQIQAIDIIEKKIGLDELPEELRVLAMLRREYKSESLSKLGKMLSPPLGKSGVNHRFNRIIAIAERLSTEAEEMI